MASQPQIVSSLAVVLGLTLASSATATEPSARWTQLAPPARTDARVVFDPVRDRLFVLGGFTGAGVPHENDIWSLSSVEGSSWEQLHPAAIPPPLWDWRAVYDAARDRVLVIHYDLWEVTVWALTFSPTLRWERLLPYGEGPDGRFAGSLAYDPIGDRLLLYGGGVPVRATPYNTTRYLDDLWSLSLGSPPTWSRLSPGGQGPSPREGAVMVVDATRGRAILFGGGGDRALPRDTWSLNLRGPLTWSLVDSSTAAPRGRWGHSMLVDVNHDRVLMFGGVVNWAAGPPELWSLPLDGSEGWTSLDIPGSPGVEAAEQAATFDPIRNRMITYAGVDLAHSIWSLSLADSLAWSHVRVPEELPPARGGHTATYVSRHKMVVRFGGCDRLTYQNDLWAATLGATLYWTHLAAVGDPPSPRAFHTAVYDSVADRIVVYGGQDSAGPLGDVWALSFTSDPPSWTRLSSAGGPPRARSGHSAVFDVQNQGMLVFGGENGRGQFEDLWELSLSGVPHWDSLSVPEPRPSARSLHAALLDASRRMWVFGGKSDYVPQGDLWQLTLDSPRQWQPVVASGPRPRGRFGHGAVFDPASEALIFVGGTITSGSSGVYSHEPDGWILSLRPSPEWHRVESNNFPGGDDCRALVRDPLSGRVVLVGEGGFRLGFWDIPLGMEGAEWVLDYDLVGEAPPRTREVGTLKVAPNPTPGIVRIELELGVESPVNGRVAVFDLSGRRIRDLADGYFRDGRYLAWWDGRDGEGRRMPAGVYYCGFVAPSIRLMRKVVLIQ